MSSSNPLATSPSAQEHGTHSKRQELSVILRLGWPMMLTQLFIMGTGFLDTAMAGHYSSEDLAGVSLGGSVLWPIFLLLTGTTMALTPISAQLVGAKRVGEVGAQIRQGLWICATTATLLVLVLANAAPLFAWFDVDPDVQGIAIDYLAAVAWGAPAVVFYVMFRHVSEGLGHTLPPMLIAGSILPLNAFLNYALIYGKFGFPELGGIGCGWATAAVFWIELLLMLFVIRRPYFRATGFFNDFLHHLRAPQLPIIRSILTIGVPIGFSIFLEMAVFSLLYLLIAEIGVIEVAAHSIAGNLNWMTYVIPMSLGAAASIRVGNHVGAGALTQARHTALVVYQFSIVYALIMSVLLVTLRYHFISVYTTDPAVIELAATALLFIAVYQLVDDSQAVTIGALRGYKDTRVPMIFSLVGYWLIALPLGHQLAYGIPALGVEPLGFYGYWTGLTLGITLVAICVGIRLWQISGNHAKVRVLAAT